MVDVRVYQQVNIRPPSFRLFVSFVVQTKEEKSIIDQKKNRTIYPCLSRTL
jgi:hypothetical protein